MKLIKIQFTSDIAKALSERTNVLSWAMGGINYLGLDLSGTIKAIVIIGGWVALQYVSLVFLRASGILKEEESHHGNI
ncbi:MAG: hypothetical protein E6Q32_09720 [Neisseriales bacterium]|jgi:hypothetical protein|nr:MAG: hypothetical protein E6Q32_09720 [Neisseriales bacterium]